MGRYSSVVAVHALLLAAGLSNVSFAADTGAIAGHVATGRNHKALAGAIVEIRESGQRMTTAADGAYAFTGIAPGNYTLVVTPPDGKAVESSVSVAAGQTTQQDLAVGVKITALESVVVLAQRTPAATAREAQKEAPNLINIATYEEIRKLPDISTAEAVRRIPGISLETDEGEGRYVNIRGFDADLNSTTFGGLRLPPTNNASPFGGYRAVTLDSIPIGLVGAITVTKSNTPSMDAEALGGTIEITPKTAPGNGQPFIQGNIGSGYEPLRSTGIIDAAVTGGGRFGGGDSPYSRRPFSVVLTATYYDDKRGIDDVEPAYFNDNAHPFDAINNIQQRDYELHRRRHGYGADFGYQPNPDNNWYVRAFDAGYTERYYRQFLNLTPDGATTALPNGKFSDTLSASDSNGGTTAIQMALRDEVETSRDRVFVAGGKNLLGENILDYRVGFTQGSYKKPFDYNSAFDYLSAGTTPSITYDLSGPGHTPAYTISGADYTDSSKYQLSSFSNSTAHNFDKEFSFAENLELPLNWTQSDSESLKFGTSIRLRKKRTTAQPFSYPSLPTLLLSDITSASPETYYAGHYQNAPDIPPSYLQSVLGSGSVASGDQIAADQQYLDAKENVYAGYFQYQVTRGRVGVLGGLRVEGTKDDSNAFQSLTTTTPNPDPTQPPIVTTTVTPVQASHGYTNFFPSLQGRFEIEPDLIGRATYSSTLARPGFNQGNASLSVDLGSGLVTEGNPSLKPATSNSFDLSLEKYLKTGGIISAGVFDKEISNYIVANETDNQSLPQFGTVPLRLVTYTNASHSHARGVELNFEKRFRGLPGIWGGLGAGLNYTYVDSKFEIRPGEYSPLPSTSRNTWNATVFYEKYGLNLRLAAYSVSKDLFAIGAVPSTTNTTALPGKTSDVYNAQRTSMDFGSSYDVIKHWTVYFNAKNLLNTPHKFYQGDSERTIQREFYGQTYQLGVRFDY